MLDDGDMQFFLGEITRSPGALGIHKTYDRSKYEGYYGTIAKKEVAEATFKGHNSAEDFYTGKTLLKNQQAAARKYHGAYRSHIPQVDHINPLKDLHEEEKEAWFLSDKDLQHVGNMKLNMRTTSAVMNQSKNDLTNVQFVLREHKRLKIRDISLLLVDEAKATVAQKTYITAMKVKNAGFVFAEGVRSNALYLAYRYSFAVVRELTLYMQGKKNKEEVLQSLGKEGASGILETGGKELVTESLKLYLKKHRHVVLQKYAKVLKNSSVLVLLDGAFFLKDDVFAYLNGDISKEELVLKGSSIGAQLLLPQIGESLYLGPQALLLTLASLAIMAISQSLINNEREYQAAIKEEDRRVARMNRLSHIALAEMQRQRETLKAMLHKQNEYWDQTIETSYNDLFEAITNDDAYKVATGLDKILELFGEHVRFRDSQEVKNSILRKETFEF